ncbi:MAG: hypothetical protein QOH91_917, partial [Mycobacterium sp.]|nr:hypothetical protein [Mycobacterium sp.]
HASVVDVPNQYVNTEIIAGAERTPSNAMSLCSRPVVG